MLSLIEWLSLEEGGRRSLPTGLSEPPYSPVVRFLDEPWPPEIMWSFSVRKEREIDNPYQWVAEVDYRMADAPHERLREGREFELYEGPRCVARGKLVSEAHRLTKSEKETTSV